jgi:hypothetical protein
MNSRSEKQQRLFLAFAVGLASLALTLNVGAQVQTQTKTTVGYPTTEVQVGRAKVVLVDGNDLVVRTEDGRLVHFANIPESARATVDGQELSIHDLKPGMMLERTITTTTTPETITTVKSVTGTVWYVNPPSSVILTLENGTNQKFKIPKGQKFNIDGQMMDAWGLKKGMKISATKVTEAPEEVVEQQKLITGTMPPEPPADIPILVVLLVPEVAAPAPTPVNTAAATPASLPKTASQLPLIGILGAFALILGLALRVIRLRAARVRA